MTKWRIFRFSRFFSYCRLTIVWYVPVSDWGITRFFLRDKTTKFIVFFPQLNDEIWDFLSWLIIKCRDSFLADWRISLFRLAINWLNSCFLQCLIEKFCQRHWRISNSFFLWPIVEFRDSFPRWFDEFRDIFPLPNDKLYDFFLRDRGTNAEDIFTGIHSEISRFFPRKICGFIVRTIHVIQDFPAWFDWKILRYSPEIDWRILRYLSRDQKTKFTDFVPITEGQLGGICE